MKAIDNLKTPLRLLAWDTSSKVGSVALLEVSSEFSPKILSEWKLDVQAVHSEKLLWVMDQILKSADLKMQDIDLLAVGEGPGSFTGIRIAVVTARTLSLSVQKPVIGVCSLQALIWPAVSWLNLIAPQTEVVALRNAFGGEVYWIAGSAEALFKKISQGSEVELEKLSLIESLENELLKKFSTSTALPPVVFVGDPSLVEKFQQSLRPVCLIQNLPPFYSDSVDARWIGMLAWQKYALTPEKLLPEPTPRYLKPSHAEAKLQAGQIGLGLGSPEKLTAPEGELKLKNT